MRFPLSRLRAAPLVLAAAIAGCGGGGESPAPVADLSGKWAEPVNVPGAQFQFTLAQQGNNVTGTGTFSIEAGPNGTLGATGTVQDGAVTLVFQYSTGLTANFTGNVTAPGVIKGTLAFTGGIPPPSFVEFDRTGA
jgi:hypothetical protein